MRIDRFTIGSLLIICACVTAAAAPKDSAAPGGQENGQPLAAMASGDGTASTADGVVPVDGGATLIDSAGETALVVVPQTCDTFGNTELDGRCVDCYRGNIYRVEYTGTLLNEIKMEFSFSGNVDMTFSVRAAPSGDVPQVFKKLDGVNDVTVKCTGVGRPALCSSGPLNIALAKGFDYAIGVNWGRVSAGGSTVTWFNDSRQNPIPFTHGQVIKRCLLNSALPPELQFNLCTNIGAFSMELCFSPVPGACCSTAGCIDTNTGDACTAAGSFYNGDRSDCRDVPCSVGACCMPCGGADCKDDYTPQACESLGGQWAGRGVSCVAGLCPKITGACCTGSACTEECIDDCAAIGGEYLGDSTTCFPNMCAGACCVHGIGCADLTQSVCNSIAGPSAFRGLGTTCAALDPADECGGACCGTVLGQSRCFAVNARGDCTEQAPGLIDTVYLGDAVGCNNFTDPCVAPTTGACCLPNGDCLVGTAEFCGVAGGFFTSGATCEGMTCSVACCLPQGVDEPDACVMAPSTPATACADGGGTQSLVQPGTCVPNPCTIQLGPCCFIDRCEPDRTRTDCEAAGGRFADGLDCTACPLQVGACCRPMGSCEDLVTVTECDSVFLGVYQGDGTLCDDPNVACDQRGACCTETGVCLFVLQEECFDLGGVFTAGQTCPTATCISGACCITAPGADAQCELRRADACPNDGTHFYQGDDSACDPDVCTVAACCLPVGGCVDVFGFECFQQSGEFNVGVTCSVANACEVGACCTAGDCTAQTGAACASRGGFYEGPGVTCAAGMCDVGSCCERTNTCTADVVRSQCDATNGLDFRAGVSCASPLPCVEIGACCLDDGTCVDATTTTECDALSGQLTAGVGCGPGVCAISIIGSDPPNCSIDAAQPFRPDGSGPSGWDTLELTFDGDPSSLTVDSFTPPVLGISTLGNTATITIAPISPGRWTCITHIDSGKQICLGFLPGDSGGDGRVLADDVTTLIDCINGNATCDLWRCDLDRSGTCGPADLLRSIDLIGGAEMFLPGWIGESIGACPSQTP